MANAARDVVLHGQDPRHDMDLSGNRVYFGTAGAAVHVVDPRTREYRESTLADLYDIARLVDTLEHIHFFQRPIVCRDMEDPRDLDFNTCYAAVAGTSKHVGTSWVQPGHVDESIAMLHRIAGDEARWRARPFVSMSSCFVVPPLRFAEDACRCLEAGVRGGMPILLLAAGQAGATSPAALAGAVVQEVAEVLAGLVYVNALSPGHPAIFGTWPFVSDLRTGAMSGGSGEQAVLMAACAQMGRFYDLPTGVAAGMADSKLPDAQAGYEKGYTTVLAGHSGANLVYESAGMLASLLGVCLESFVIDNDMLGAVNRSVRGSTSTTRASPSRRCARCARRGRTTSSGIRRPSGSCSASTSTRRSATARARRNGASRARPRPSNARPCGCARRWPVITRRISRRRSMPACARTSPSGLRRARAFSSGRSARCIGMPGTCPDTMPLLQYPPLSP